VATEAVCQQFNELRSEIVLLYELQQALTNCDFEFQTLRHRYESIAPGKVKSNKYFLSQSSIYLIFNFYRVLN